jgi:hypothetical protein
MSGYLSPLYASSLRGIGEPFELPTCGGWLLKRQIEAGGADVIGCYPRLFCRDWSSLVGDVESLRSQFVSLAVVPDPFGATDAGMLQRVFPDLYRPFKDHYVVDLHAAPVVPSHHRRNVRVALRSVSVERCEDPGARAREWTDLYANLVRRHRIRGSAAFSPEALAEQLGVPGLFLFRAAAQGECVGMMLWYEGDGVAYYHLGACSDTGYALRASYALVHVALETFRGRVRWADLGGGAGVVRRESGLTRFKQGWATGTRTAFICGRVLDPIEYARLSAGVPTRAGADAFFPAYRNPGHA